MVRAIEIIIRYPDAKHLTSRYCFLGGMAYDLAGILVVGYLFGQ